MPTAVATNNAAMLGSLMTALPCLTEQAKLTAEGRRSQPAMSADKWERAVAGWRSDCNKPRFLCRGDKAALPMYKISGIVSAGVIAAPRMAETAKGALQLLRDAREKYARVWINDDEGNDVSEAELERRAEREGGDA